MKTFLPQNEFMSSASHVPIDVVPAAGSPLPPSKSAAALIQNLACSSAVEQGAVNARVAGSSPAMPAISVSMASSAGAMETEAAVGAIPAASDISDVPEIFRVANLLCVEAREFIPDYPGIYQAMLDENAPRAFETDPVWDDASPMFLHRDRS